MMRLICPNCGAQYEVPDDVIPAGGRDVQCSNCGHTWLERPGASVAEEYDAPDAVEQVSVADTVAETTATVAEDEPPVVDTPGDDAAEDQTNSTAAYTGSIEEAFADIDPEDPPAELPDTVSTFEEAEGETPPTTAPQRRPVDASVAAILQEEAAREAAAREAEAATGLESQTDLGLDDAAAAPPNRAEDTRRIVAGMVEDEAAAAAEAAEPPDTTAATVAASTAAAAGSRRELLPDIEEINSSLRSNAERGEDDIAEPEEVEAEKRRGFRAGFLTVLIVLAILWAIYMFAPQIAEQVPALAGPLETYVNGVDAGRIWLDIKANELLEMIRPATDDSGG